MSINKMGRKQTENKVDKGILTYINIFKILAVKELGNSMNPSTLHVIYTCLAFLEPARNVHSGLLKATQTQQEM